MFADTGDVYSFGSDYDGCMGCSGGEGEVICSPVLLKALSGLPVSQISCGKAHVVILLSVGQVYSWGSGEFGNTSISSNLLLKMFYIYNNL